MDKLSYYCFDWDDNLLKMPTLINMLALVNGTWQPVKITTNQFSLVRKDKDNWMLDANAFSEFSDNGSRKQKAFISDLQVAIGDVKYPDKPISYATKSWDKFIESILRGSIISIITARGHSSETLKNGVEWIIDNYLTNKERRIIYDNCIKFYRLINPYYDFTKDELDYDNITKNIHVKMWLTSCGFYAVSNPTFILENPGTEAESPEYGKEIALKDFVSRCNSYSKNFGVPFEAGISDDDIGNVLHIKTVLSELLEMYPDCKFTLFDTSNGGYEKTTVENEVKED